MQVCIRYPIEKSMYNMLKLMKDRNIFSNLFAAYILYDELPSFITFGMPLSIDKIETTVQFLFF